MGHHCQDYLGYLLEDSNLVNCIECFFKVGKYISLIWKSTPRLLISYD